ncbi:MAG: type IV pilus modification PilV family protein [Telluria sp.]
MKRQVQQGFALIEALIAVALLAIGLLGTVALQAKSYAALSDAGMRAEATIAAEQLLGEMTTDQANLASYAFSSGTPSDQLAPWYNATRARIPNATITVAVTPQGTPARTRVDISISWQRKTGDQTNRHDVTSYIAGAL